MSNKFIDSIKHAIIEDDDPKPESKPAQTEGPAKTTSSEAAAVAPARSYPAVSEPMDEEIEHIYQRILAKTDFESTAVAATIHKYLEPLKAIPTLDERTRFKTAVVQARAQEGLTQEKIFATFDGLKVALQNEKESFSASAQATRQHEIADRQQQLQETAKAIAEKQKEIAQLQQQLAAMNSELAGAQGKIQRTEAQFNKAAQRRAAEIDQEKAKYLSLLQG